MFYFLFLSSFLHLLSFLAAVAAACMCVFYRPRKVVAFGNVLLDHTAHINDTELLDRYKLSLNTRAEMDVETITKVTAEAIADK